MKESNAAVTALAWQEAANAQDVDRLLGLSAPDIAIVGPRGTGYGHQLLREWLGRAGLHLATRRIFVRDEAVVMAQHGTWRAAETGEVTGERAVASVFLVADGRVVRLARHDDLDGALAEAGLGLDDEQEVPGS